MLLLLSRYNFPLLHCPPSASGVNPMPGILFLFGDLTDFRSPSFIRPRWFYRMLGLLGKVLRGHREMGDMLTMSSTFEGIGLLNLIGCGE